jgi:hypothetical protein
MGLVITILLKSKLSRSGTIRLVRNMLSWNEQFENLMRDRDSVKKRNMPDS